MVVAGKISFLEASPVTCAHDNTIFSKMKYTFCTNYCPLFLAIPLSPPQVYPVYLLLSPAHLPLFCAKTGLYFRSVDFLRRFFLKTQKNGFTFVILTFVILHNQFFSLLCLLVHSPHPAAGGCDSSDRLRPLRLPPFPATIRVHHSISSFINNRK